MGTFHPAILPHRARKIIESPWVTSLAIARVIIAILSVDYYYLLALATDHLVTSDRFLFFTLPHSLCIRNNQDIGNKKTSSKG